ncbi:hypothetical protein AU476_16925 [Cupriavidus sp. UYMSc13B]|nr:hypothetical protein AU476_16925 [Cupriavidus sp. UYMSc13B]
MGDEALTVGEIVIAGRELTEIEVNSLPGMTSTSLLPQSATASGLPAPYIERVPFQICLVL